MLRRFLLWLLFLPLQIVIAFLFVAEELVRALVYPFKPRETDLNDPKTKLCSIVVLNWNGRHLLEESLPALVQAVLKTGKRHEILVVDNGSEDDSISWVNQHYPDVRVLALDRNYGFGEGNNRGVQAASHDIVVLLNNDMIVSEDFLTPLVEAFSDSSVFAVASQVFFPPGKRREETGNTRGWIEWGYLNLSHEPIEDYHYSRHYLPVLWAGGGAAAFDRTRFLALGGFSDIFSPCYFEDTDLSYRAWRRGWKVLVAAHSQVLHKHRSTSSSRFGASDLGRLVEQRRLWYLWKNYALADVLRHLIWFPIQLTVKIGVRDYLGALKKLPRVLLSRLAEPRHRFGHRPVFRWIEHPLSYLNFFYPGRALAGKESRSRLRILAVSAYLPHLGYHGGAGRVFQLLIRVALKHDLSLLTFVETERESEEVVQIKPHCKRVETVLRRAFKPVSPYPYEPFEEFNTAEFRTRMEKLLTEEDFDVIHYEWTQMAQYADLAPRLPSLLTEIEVNYAAHQSQVRYERNPIRRFKRFYDTLQTLYRELEMCRRADRVICVTDVDKDFLKGYLPPEKLDVINTGVDTQYFRPGKPRLVEPDSIVFVGAFRHQPNIDAMTYFCSEVFPLILSQIPEATLYIVGSSPPDTILKLGTHPRIKVTGFVPDIRDYYRRAQVVVVPVRTGVGIRGKILEGWAAGKAMVATPVACLGIRAIHGENIMVADSPGDFATWTVALLSNPDFCLKLAKAGRLTAERYYDWGHLGERLAATYESLAGFKRIEATEAALAVTEPRAATVLKKS
jgi:GT2 family glycosyltransferase/glycosyltransferase involved in cell wall biosynthesis